MYKVTVHQTRGSQTVVVETNAKTWGELKEDLKNNNVDPNGMTAIVGENKMTLDLASALLPKGITVGSIVTDNFTLFLTPKTQKAGV